MNKPESLRVHLLDRVPELRHNPDRLLIFIDNGKVRCTAAASLSFEYSYDLQV
ncbi:phage tail protein, partial [Pseudomonas sp. B6(2017)]